MGSFLAYTIYSGIFLLFLYLFYQLFISKEKQIALNRAILLGCYAVALTAWPLSRIEWGGGSTEGNVTDLIATAGTLQPEMLITAESSSSMIPQILMWIYLVGASAVLLHTLISTVRLGLYIRKGNAIRKDGYRIVVMTGVETAPFSIGRTIVMNEVDYATVREAVTSHELAHIRCRHYLDLVLAQAVCVVLWYNPAAWLMRDELKLLHEYQADEKVLEGGADPKEYQMLLIRKTVGSRMHILANNLNHSKLKHRIAMMQKEKSKGRRRLRILTLALAVEVALGIVNNPAVAADLNVLADTNLSIDNGNENSVTHVQAPEKVAEFPGGPQKLMEFLAMNLRYPQSAIEENRTGRPTVAFTIEADGSISDVRVVRSASPDLDEEAVRVVKKMPNWIPGKTAGKPVASEFLIPVSFRLPDVESSREGRADNEFDEVVVVGYGTVKKSAEAQDTDMKETSRVGSKELVLKGGGRDNPAIFIDGAMFEGDLQVIDPSAIESISVRKDSPEYPNGVIDIKLKKEGEVFIQVQGDKSKLVVGATPDENCDAKDNSN